MTEFLAADSSLANQGHRSFLVGVALKIRNGTEFDDHYFRIMEEICEDYDIELQNSVLDASTIISRIRSYQVRDVRDRLAESIVRNPAIEQIHVTIGWYLDKVEIKGKTINGRTFTQNHLEQYFPVVTAWHCRHRALDWDDTPRKLWLDNVQGPITKAWKYLGNVFEINLVPHGDITYPSMSSADIIANYLGDVLSKDKDFTELSDEAHKTISRLRDGTDEISAGHVYEGIDNTDHIVPEYDYSIRSELYYPHPVYFVHDDHFSEYDENVLRETAFHGLLRRHAQETTGCVVGLDPYRLPTIVRDGDRIVYTQGSNETIPEALKNLNPTTNIELLDSESLINEYMSK